MNLIDKIDRYLLDKEHQRSENHYPSEATKCLRALFYSRRGVPKSNPMEAGAIWKCEMGNAIHGQIAKWLNDMGIEAQEEIPFKMEVEGLKYKISGRVDNIFTEINEQVGVEIKTTFGRGVVEIQKKRQPKREALIQAALYLFSPLNITKWYIIYVGRDNAYRCQFEVTKKKDKIYLEGKPTGITLETIVQKFKDVEKAIDENNLPEREYKVAIKNGQIRAQGFQKNCKKYKGDWQCTYCAYRDHCWTRELEEYKDSDNSKEL